AAVGDVISAAGHRVFLEEVVAGLTDLVGDLVAATKSRLAGAEPRNLPGKADGRTEVVIVVLVPRRVCIRRVLAEVSDSCVFAADAGFHPVPEAGARNPPDGGRAANRGRHQAVGLIGNAKEVPSQSEVECQAFFDLPVVLEKGAHFVRVEVANPPW